MACPRGWCPITSAVPWNLPHPLPPGAARGAGGRGAPRPAPLGCRAQRPVGVGPAMVHVLGGNGDILGKTNRLRLQRLQSWENTVHRISSSVDVGPLPLSPCEEEVPFAHESAESRSPQPGKAHTGHSVWQQPGLPLGTSGDFPRSLARSAPAPRPCCASTGETQRGPWFLRGRRGAASAQRGPPSPRCSASRIHAPSLTSCSSGSPLGQPPPSLPAGVGGGAGSLQQKSLV